MKPNPEPLFSQFKSALRRIAGFDAKLVIFIGGNQFFVLPQLIAAFEQQHPALKGHIFYETLPPGILQKQIAANDAITLGNLTIQVKPDVYEAGARVMKQMEQENRVKQVQGSANLVKTRLHRKSQW